MTCKICNGNNYVVYDDDTYATCTACLGKPDKLGRDAALEEAGELINGERARDYGDAQENFRRIAVFWSELFRQPVSLEQVSLAMIMAKNARLIETPTHHDSWVDITGYGALGAERADAKAKAWSWFTRSSKEAADD